MLALELARSAALKGAKSRSLTNWSAGCHHTAALRELIFAETYFSGLAKKCFLFF